MLFPLHPYLGFSSLYLIKDKERNSSTWLAQAELKAVGWDKQLWGHKQHISCQMGEELMVPLLRCHARPTRLSRSQAMAKVFPETEQINAGARGWIKAGFILERNTIKSSRRAEKANGSLWECVTGMVGEVRSFARWARTPLLTFGFCCVQIIFQKPTVLANCFG